MAVQKRFTKPVQIVETPEMDRRVRAIAEVEGVSIADVYRDLHAAAIDEREKASELRAALGLDAGRLTSDQLGEVRISKPYTERLGD